jgi:hypothetical protein
MEALWNAETTDFTMSRTDDVIIIDPTANLNEQNLRHLRGSLPMHSSASTASKSHRCDCCLQCCLAAHGSPIRGSRTKPTSLVTNHRDRRELEDDSPLSHDEADMVQLAHRYQRLARQRTRGSLKHMHGLALHSSTVRQLDRSRRASSRDRTASLLSMYKKQASKRRSSSHRHHSLMRSKLDQSLLSLMISL